MNRAALLVAGAMFVAWTGSGLAQSGAMSPSGGMHMKMAMPEEPAHFAPTRQAYTENRRFLVKLATLPQPIPYQKYFDLRFVVYDGRNPQKELTDAKLTVEAGMRHGLKHGFAHGMQSTPKLSEKDGEFTLSGMYFHMMGPWVIKLTVEEGGKQGTAYFRLPCCGT
jgi:hypothetical protein